MATNLEKAQEVTNIIGLSASMPIYGKLNPYVTFLGSNPAVLTSFSGLVSRINDGTATRSDYVNTLTAIGATGAAVADLIALAGTGATLGLPTMAFAVGLGALAYLDSKDYNLTAVKNDLKDIGNFIAKEVDETLKPIVDSYVEEIMSSEEVTQNTPAKKEPETKEELKPTETTKTTKASQSDNDEKINFDALENIQNDEEQEEEEEQEGEILEEIEQNNEEQNTSSANGNATNIVELAKQNVSLYNQNINKGYDDIMGFLFG
ncbi:MAG: hypothetical protein MR782_02735 [Campylobacter sp.]|uniref:hypothetical protein n=1 Tax=Campylobacter sp. TaxID=205 RepID=UPI002AA6096A|nr:hypothetical protein [Campylobacter sp.]MCI6339764.1 hypothetical protein [Campylobacter sp.]MCI7581537.1 hypothetical protein [Campylobacter sp.]